ncbi:MAG: glycosyltransferase, partial [Defluviitaleaceae bacterium]|nr:glycosyltransferase [Defluviitaleaceae bacterium]
MNIGIFTDTYSPQINGVATSIVTLRRELEKRGHMVFLFTAKDPAAESKEARVFRMPSVPLVFSPAYRATYMCPPRLLLSM